MTDDVLRPLREESDLDEACGLPLAVVLKHSPRCGMSAMTLRRVRDFAEQHPDLPVYVVDVVAHRQLSQSLAARLGVWHESPQAIVLRGGAVVWHDSHSAVTVDALTQAIAPIDHPG